MKKKYFFIIMLLFIASCINSKNSKEYVTWVEDIENGLRQKKQSPDYSFDLQYTPRDYWRAKGSLMEGDLQIFILRIEEKHPKEDSTQFHKDYYSYSIEKDIVLSINDSTYTCVMAHYENPYQVKPHHTILLGFDAPDLQEKSFSIRLNSSFLTKKTLSFDFSKLSIPLLKTENK